MRTSPGRRTAAFLAFAALAVTAIITSSTASGADSRAVPGTVSAGGGAAGDATAGAPGPFTTIDVNGGYTAAGVSLRNRGRGTISIKDIPAGSTVRAAYLYWSILGNTEGTKFKLGTFNGASITGTKVGSGAGPCWPTATNGYAYRANVSTRVTGNGSYRLTGFASGITNASDPWDPNVVQKAPLAEGASLVVVYANPKYPRTNVVIRNGYGLVTTNTISATIPFGFAAPNPVGLVRTTFIGGDGQSSSEQPSTFNGVAVSHADWDGTDPPNPKYTLGNLWDTDSAIQADRVRPGDTSATVTVSGGQDCLVWVAQVVSIERNGNLDTDGDKLLDAWEANGYDGNGDNIVDVNLPKFGARIDHKDLFVEMDYMGAETTCPCHLPLDNVLDRIVAVYASAPQANNPDGKTGIAVHLDAGSARAARYNLGGGNLVPFDADLNPVVTEFNAIKANNFSSLRAKVFYYMIWAHGYDGGTSSGNAFAIPNDSFVVTLAAFPQGGTDDAKVGTFVHEFGHDLGQLHGGTDNTNYKPNYLSVMNYAFQIGGVPLTAGGSYFGYSSAALPTLVETSLDEGVGLNSASANPYRTYWFCPNGTQVATPGTANGPIDWNCNGSASGVVSADINRDFFSSSLTSFNNWGNIIYGGGQVGFGVGPAAKSTSPSSELTLEEARDRNLLD